MKFRRPCLHARRKVTTFMSFQHSHSQLKAKEASEKDNLAKTTAPAQSDALFFRDVIDLIRDRG